MGDSSILAVPIVASPSSITLFHRGSMHLVHNSSLLSENCQWTLHAVQEGCRTTHLMNPKPSLTLMTHPIRGRPSAAPLVARDTRTTSFARSPAAGSCCARLNSTLSPGLSLREDSRRSAGLNSATCSLASSSAANVGFVKAILPGVMSCGMSQELC